METQGNLLGDEMNMHVPQSIQTSIELEELVCVNKQIIGPGQNRPVIGLVQDSVIGSNLFTSYNNFLTINDIKNLLIWIPKYSGEFENLEKTKPIYKKGTDLDEILKDIPDFPITHKTVIYSEDGLEIGEDLWSGRQLLEIIIPKIYLSKKNSQYNDASDENKYHHKIEIENGKYNNGVLDKSILGNKSQGLIHVIFNDLGYKKTQEFLDDIQNLITNWLVTSGFSVGISDLMISETNEVMKKLITEKKKKVIEIIEHVHQGILENNTGKPDSEEFEIQVNKNLNAAVSEAGKKGIKELSGDNRMIGMVKSGSKGSIINIGQMIACLGQQNVDGKRIPYGFTNRTLPHFHKYDDGPSSRGFVESSFVEGLSPTEFFFHAMGGREGLIDTAVKSVTGDTKLIIIENGKPMNISIGNWIDEHLEKNKENIKHYGSKNANMELIDLSKLGFSIYVYTIDNKGNSFWSPITNITRHDPSEFIYEIKTKSGRSVKVVASKSLLIWNEEKHTYEPTETKEINIGDKVPVITEFKTFRQIDVHKELEFKINIDNKETFLIQNDTIMDEITSINKFKSKEHSKVYDLTVPKTKNFGLANGLQVYDTSETGYIQRKLVKSMENLKICLDLTVRDSNNSIVQFLYGEDGMESTKVEKQYIDTINMEFKDIERKYRFNVNEYFQEYVEKDILDSFTDEIKHGAKKMKDKYLVACEKHFQQILKDKKFVIEKIWIDNPNPEIYYPVNLDRLLINIKAKFARHVEKTDLDPMYILETFDELDRKLFVTKPNRGNKLLNILIRCKLSPKIIMKEIKLNKLAFNQLVQEIITKFQQSISVVGEAVGIIAAQSIGEPCTQLTLNSVDYNTDILLKENNRLIKCKMGEYIDKFIENSDNRNIENHKNETTLAYVKDRDLQILSVDEDGNMSWKEIEAVTQHLPINKDGSSTLLKVKTDGGREVIATKAKSFLTIQNNKILPKEGAELKIGEYLPINCKQFDIEIISKLDLSEYLPKTEYIYGTDFNKAKDVCHEYHWWSKYNGKLFQTPFKRSDTLYAKINGGLRKNCKTKQDIKIGFVYPKQCVKVKALIPEYISLDREFGYLVGAYLAEGCLTNTQISISNNDMDYLKPIEKFCIKHNISYKYYVHRDEKGWTSSDVRIYSVVLTRLFNKLFGKGSENKHIPSVFLQAPKECLIELANAYISGDGCVHKKESITVSSVSRNLLKDIQQILLQINSIYSKIKGPTKILRNNRNSQNTKDMYKLRIMIGKDIVRFGEKIKLIIKSKQERLDKYLQRDYKYNNGLKNRISEYSTNDGKIHKNINKDKLEKIIGHSVFKDCVFERVVSIEPYTSDYKYVYDFTVKDTKNFNCFDGLAIRDTFHFAGVASKSQVVRGVPRIKEIINASKNMKSPCLTVYLDEEHCYDKEKATDIINLLEITTIKDIILESKIYWDPITEESLTGIEEDKPLLEIYKEFSKYLEQPNDADWLLRLEFDIKHMLDKNIKMFDIYQIIDHKFNGNKYDINCVFSDDNSSNLIFRIKFNDNKEVDNNDAISILKHIERTILGLTIKGIKGINKASMMKEENIYKDVDGKFAKKPEWVIDTDGSNLIEVLGQDGINTNKTLSNNIMEIYDIFGIEAVREILIKEILEVISFDGTYVNYRHVSLLADTMTNKGRIMSVQRHGINKSDRGPLAKCSFEETPDILIKAALFGELDNLNGVSSNIMLGQEIKAGTGCVDLLFDEEKFLESHISKKHIEKKIDEEIEILDTYCTEENIDINVSIDESKKEVMGDDEFTIPEVLMD